jgi:hypothetical protein
LQSPEFPVQTGTQTPALQLVPLALTVEQARAQAPQLATSRFRLASQPSSGLLTSGVLQSPYPLKHTGTQLPATQLVAVALSVEHP